MNYFDIIIENCNLFGDAREVKLHLECFFVNKMLNKEVITHDKCNAIDYQLIIN